MRILVAYGSRYGSTRHTAGHIAHTLELDGHRADVLEASAVTDFASYDMVVVGSGIYVGHLRLRIRRLLHRIARESPRTPVALFGQGPTSPADAHPEDWATARRIVADAGASIAGLNVVSTTVFGGVVSPERMPRLLAGAAPVDLRDWDAIDAWTRAIVDRADTAAA